MPGAGDRSGLFVSVKIGEVDVEPDQPKGRGGEDRGRPKVRFALHPRTRDDDQRPRQRDANQKRDKHGAPIT